MIEMKKRSEQANIRASRRYDPEKFRYLSDQIMHLALRGLLRIDFLNETSKILMEFSGCDSVEMWLKERGKYYRSEVTRSRKRPFRFEIMPVIKDEKGSSIPRLKRNSPLERLCLDIFLKQYDSSFPFFTDNGSFWTKDIEKSFVALFKKRQAAGSGRSILNGNYRSLIVIPISVKNEIIGLMQL